MKFYGGLFLAVLLIVCVYEASCQQKPPEPKVGQPQFSLQGAGGGKDLKNWQGGFKAGVDTKVWQSPNNRHSVNVGGSYGQGFVRHQGHTFKSRPDIGGKIGYTYKFGRK